MGLSGLNRADEQERSYVLQSSSVGTEQARIQQSKLCYCDSQMVKNKNVGFNVQFTLVQILLWSDLSLLCPIPFPRVKMFPCALRRNQKCATWFKFYNDTIFLHQVSRKNIEL